MVVHWFCNPVMAVRFCRGAPNNASVIQLDRKSVFETEGWEFESLRTHHIKTHCIATMEQHQTRLARGVLRGAMKMGYRGFKFYSVFLYVGGSSMVEPRIVIPMVAGSSPVCQPNKE